MGVVIYTYKTQAAAQKKGMELYRSGLKSIRVVEKADNKFDIEVSKSDFKKKSGTSGKIRLLF